MSTQAHASSDAKGAAFAFVEQLASELSSGQLELPAFPDIAVRVRDALNDPEVSIDKITRIVLSDPLLTAQLLRMSNSAMLMRGSQEVTDLKTAISRMGFKIVRNAAVSRAMDSTFSAPEGSFLRSHISDLRKHSVQVASLSYLLAKRQSHMKHPDEAMLAGLLHDIGKFYILTRIEEFPDLLNNDEEFSELLVQWHTGVGRSIVESWGFRDQIAEAVDEHEELDRTHLGPADLTDVVIAGNLIAKMNDQQVSEWPDIDGIPSCQKLQLNKQTVDKILEESADEIDSLSQALNG